MTRDVENGRPGFTTGDRVTWHREMRGGYGYVVPVPAIVERVTPHRVRIRARLEAGGTKVVSVKPASLRARDYHDPIDDAPVSASP